MAIDYSKVPSPCFVLDEDKFRSNLQLIKEVSVKSGAEIILAFKGFAMWSTFPIVKEYLRGATASSLNEALLCNEEMGVKAHTYSVAYAPNEFDEILELSSHITFNSIGQFERFKKKALGKVSCGLRVNPEWSDVETDLYNPANTSSRLGITANQFPDELPEGIEGLHLHVLCESNSKALEQVLIHFEEKFVKYLDQIKWINLGGGHLMTRKDYDTDHLISLLKKFSDKHNVQLILEPGSAFAWETGDLITSVLDIIENGGIKSIITDSSFTCHMPDTLEMPYRPAIVGASVDPTEHSHRYRLGGLSCLAGDFLEEYSFIDPVHIGDQIVFKDMIHYTTVKTTTFNGVPHPSIGIWRNNEFQLIRSFDYSDYKNRLS